MSKKNLEERLEDPDIYKNYVKGEAFGEIGAITGSYLGARIGEQVFKGQSRLLNILSGSIPGDYLLGTLFSAGYFYRKYRGEYKGFRGKLRFLKDQANFHIRESPATAASYLVYSPLVAGGLALGLAAGAAAAIASVFASALYIGGSYLLNKKYLRKLGGKQNAKEEHLSPASSQAPQYEFPQQTLERKTT